MVGLEGIRQLPHIKMMGKDEQKMLILHDVRYVWLQNINSQMKSKSMRAPQKLPCECVRGKKVEFEELDEKDWLPRNDFGVGWGVGCVVGLERSWEPSL